MLAYLRSFRVVEQKFREIAFAGVDLPDTDKRIPPGFWAITRHHGVGEVPGSVGMNPTGLPELSKTSEKKITIQKA